MEQSKYEAARRLQEQIKENNDFLKAISPSGSHYLDIKFVSRADPNKNISGWRLAEIIGSEINKDLERLVGEMYRQAAFKNIEAAEAKFKNL